MILTNLNSGAKPTYSYTGTVLTVEGLAIDLSKVQTNIQTVVTISLASDMQTVVQGSGAWMIATVIVPPVSYTVVDTGTKDAQGNEIMDVQAQPLDMGQVQLQLWALPQNYGQVTNPGGVV